MRRTSSKKHRWADHYTERARKEKYPARSVYKLQEIQRRFKLIKAGHRILDIGCAPGSWLQFAAEQTTSQGEVVGVDIKPVTIPLPPHVTTLVADIRLTDDRLSESFGGLFDVVLSDAAPATTGQKDVDAARSFQLGRSVVEMGNRYLRRGGCLVCKIFQGEEFPSFVQMVNDSFRNVKLYKPQSSRKASKEIYVIGIGKQ